MIPSIELIRRTIETEIAYTISRLQVLERIPGNPIGVSYREVEPGLWALMARHIPSPGFNRVAGLRAGHERHIAPLVEWYQAQGVPGRFEIVPGDYDAALGRALATLGYYHSGFHAAMIGERDLAVPTPSGPAVEAVATASAMEEFLDAYVAGWSIPEQYRAGFKTNVRPWLGRPGWSLYLGRIDGRAAAAATLYVRNGVGYFADAATDPAFRGRGLQMALLHRRARDAKAAGVDYVCSGAEFLSTSHRNMGRLGMRIQFIRSTWTPLIGPSKGAGE